MSRVLSAVLSFVLVVFAVILITGYFVNPHFVGESTVELDYNKEEVFRILTDVNLITANRKGVESVEILAKLGNLVAWKESTRFNGFRKYRTTKKVDNKFLRVEMTDSNYGMTGSWEFTLSDGDNSTHLTVREESDLDSIVNRGYRFYIGRDFELRAWQRSLRVGLFESLLTKP
jgi:hypothetical protein